MRSLSEHARSFRTARISSCGHSLFICQVEAKIQTRDSIPAADGECYAYLVVRLGVGRVQLELVHSHSGYKVVVDSQNFGDRQLETGSHVTSNGNEHLNQNAGREVSLGDGPSLTPSGLQWSF